ncbi:hypothetical protein FXN63_09670 [Pigmentiphaga aceris]|uniref:Uncharacterized protein n=1 Tax=Pigmentiphaga aceris TaxID=1940612 RepID=A0A5C0AXD8_9BURK|nr:hypothetical protein [Pigmentiphaga aceris]QEI06073.1 hypothetical protein FXN63_09670 [Pigmentiphaga aceris]
MQTGNVLGTFGLMAMAAFMAISVAAPKTQQAVVDGCVTGTNTAYRRALEAAPAHELTRATLDMNHAQRTATSACQCVAGRIMREEGRVRMVLMDYGLLGARDIASFDDDAFRLTMGMCSNHADRLLVTGILN